MPSNRTSDAHAEAAGPTLADLSVSELSAALGASDMPARGWRSVSRDQLAAWARQGIDRIGVQAVRERAERTAYLDYGERGIGTNTPAESAELRGMWPSVGRLDAAMAPTSLPGARRGPSGRAGNRSRVQRPPGRRRGRSSGRPRNGAGGGTMSADQRQTVGEGHVTVRLVVPEEAVRDLPSAGMTRHAEAAPETGHVDPAAAGRWHQAQSELASLIRDETQTIGQAGAEREVLLPDSLADWTGDEGRPARTGRSRPTENRADRLNGRSAEYSSQVRGGPAPPLTA